MTATKGNPSITRNIITGEEIKYLKTWFKESKEIFSKAYTIIAGFAYHRKLKIYSREKC